MMPLQSLAVAVVAILALSLVHGVPPGFWRKVLAVVGVLFAGELLLVAGLLTATVPGLRHTAWRPIRRQVEHFWHASHDPWCTTAVAAEASAAPAPAATDSEAPLTPAEYAAERAEIERIWQQNEIQRRLWHAGGIAGGLLGWLAIVVAYLKLDLASVGRYRGRLRVAAATAGTLATAAAAWAWTQPL